MILARPLGRTVYRNEVYVSYCSNTGSVRDDPC
jgi:hypothetical protein